MPIYEYKCQKCGAHTEVLQKINDKPLTKCAKCGGKVEKQWSNTSFQLKGGGWYVTDYAGKKSEPSEKKSPASTESSTSEAPASTEGGKASKESKPPAKGSTKPAATKSD